MRNLLAAALVFVATPVLAHGEPVSPGSKCHHNPPTMRAKGTHCFHPPSMLSPAEKLERRCNSIRPYLKNPIHARAARRDMAKLGCPATSSGLRDGTMRPTPASIILAAGVPPKCAAPLQAVEKLSAKVEAKLFEVEITMKHGYGKVRTLTNANALIARLGEYVTVTGELTSAYSALLDCIDVRESS